MTNGVKDGTTQRKESELHGPHLLLILEQTNLFLEIILNQRPKNVQKLYGFQSALLPIKLSKLKKQREPNFSAHDFIFCPKISGSKVENAKELTAGDATKSFYKN